MLVALPAIVAAPATEHLPFGTLAWLRVCPVPSNGALANTHTISSEGLSQRWIGPFNDSCRCIRGVERKWFQFFLVQFQQKPHSMRERSTTMFNTLEMADHIISSSSPFSSGTKPRLSLSQTPLLAAFYRARSYCFRWERVYNPFFVFAPLAQRRPLPQQKLNCISQLHIEKLNVESCCRFRRHSSIPHSASTSSSSSFSIALFPTFGTLLVKAIEADGWGEH